MIWNTDGPQTISVDYTLNGSCNALVPTVLPITVNPSPTPQLIVNPSGTIVAGNNVLFTASDAKGVITSYSIHYTKLYDIPIMPVSLQVVLCL